MFNEMVSIIIPAYNAEKNIGKSIKSVRNQTCKNIEIIVVDDGSTDNTATMILNHKNEDSRIKYIYQKNSGVSSARNTGIQAATGDFICFLDSDDFYSETYIEKMLKKCIKVNADICYCGYNLYNDGNIIHKKSKFVSKKNFLENYFKGKVYVQTACWLIKKELIYFNKIMFSETLSWGEDIDFFVKLFLQARIVAFVKENLVFYNIEANDSKLSKFDIKKIDIDNHNIKRMLGYNLTIKEKKVLERYRLPALIIFRIEQALKMNVDIEIVKKYFFKYNKEIKKISLINGMRSLKVIFTLIKLKLLYNIK